MGELLQSNEVFAFTIQCGVTWLSLIIAIIIVYRSGTEKPEGELAKRGKRKGDSHEETTSSNGITSPVMGWLKEADLDKFTQYEQIELVTQAQLNAMPKDFRILFERKKSELKLQKRKKELK